MILWITVIGAVTLVPSSEAANPSCRFLICGTRGTADAVLNILLFVPLGMLLRAARPRRVTSLWLLGPLLSLAIEGSQYLIPGRHPSVTDLLTNTTGVLAGIFIWSLLPGICDFLHRPQSHVAWSATIIGTMTIAGILMQPLGSNHAYWGQWTPRFGQPEQFAGTILSASIGGQNLPSYQLHNSETVKTLLTQSVPIRLEVESGGLPRSRVVLFQIADDAQNAIWTLAVEPAHMVFRLRTVSAALRFDSPEYRFPTPAAAFAPGRRETIVVTQQRMGVTITMNGEVIGQERWSLARSWALLSNHPSTISGLTPWLDALFLAILFVPFLLLGRAARAGFVPIAVATGVLIASPFLAAVAPIQWYEACIPLGVAGILYIKKVRTESPEPTVADP